MRSFYSKYLLPGFVFQSIVIGGGYGTGRELVEFFLLRGPFAGYLGMLVATVIWGVVLALGFELARAGKQLRLPHVHACAAWPRLGRIRSFDGAVDHSDHRGSGLGVGRVAQ